MKHSAYALLVTCSDRFSDSLVPFKACACGGYVHQREAKTVARTAGRAVRKLRRWINRHSGAAVIIQPRAGV